MFFTTEHYRASDRGDGGTLRPLRGRGRRPRPDGGQPRARVVVQARRPGGEGRPAPDLHRSRCPASSRDLRAILDGFAADCIVVDSMFLGALPLALGPRADRPALACHRRHAVRVEQPGHRAVRGGVPARDGSAAPAAQRRHELGHRALRAGRHPALRPASAGRGRRARRFPRLLHRPPAQGGRHLPAGDGGGLRVPALGPRRLGALRRSHPGPAGAVLRATAVVGRARAAAGRLSTSPRARSTTRTSAGSCW